MTQRNKFLIASLVGLVTLSILLFLVQQEEQRPEVARDYFRVGETEKINRVRLSSPASEVELRFDGSHWKVNGTWDADMQMIKVLMATLRQMEPHRPIASAVRDSAVLRLERNGTKVELFKEGVSQLSFIAGGNESKSEAWFLKSGQSQPYSVVIPGYRVYVSGIFELGAEGWRNKRIFDFNWRNFKSLSASYSQEPKQGFVVEMGRGYFGIKGMERVDTSRLNTYLDDVSLLMASRFISGPRADSLKGRVATVRIEIKDIADRTYSLELFSPRNSRRDVLGRLNSLDIVTVDTQSVGQIVKKRDFFVAR